MKKGLIVVLFFLLLLASLFNVSALNSSSNSLTNIYMKYMSGSINMALINIIIPPYVSPCPEGYVAYTGFTISAYCDCGCTSRGVCTRPGKTMAIHPRAISALKMGSHIIIPKLGISGRVEDTMGLWNTKRIDVFMNSYTSAIQFGLKKNVLVCISKTADTITRVCWNHTNCQTNGICIASKMGFGSTKRCYA